MVFRVPKECLPLLIEQLKPNIPKAVFVSLYMCCIYIKCDMYVCMSFVYHVFAKYLLSNQILRCCCVPVTFSQFS